MERIIYPLNKMKKRTILLCLLFFIFVFLFLFSRKTIHEGFQVSMTGVQDAWYINLDRSTERRKKVEQEAKKLGGLPVQRWSAVDGSKLTDKDLDSYSIPAWSRPSYAKDEKKRLNELGCLLSHKSLLQKLEEMDAPPNAGHLILEDDISIDPKTPIVWNTALQSIPSDWDIVFFGLLGNKVNNVRDGFGTPEWISGAHAYIVKHSSLPKVNESIRVVYDPIDEMFARNPHGLKIFALSPSMITQNGSKSTIVV